MHRPVSATRSVAVTAVLLMVMTLLAGCAPEPAPRSNAITLENAQPGTSSWQLTEKPSDDETRQIEGYASATSADLGEQISFQVTVNPVQHYSIDIYRMGYYQGLGGRLVRHVDRLPGIRQPDCPLDRHTGLISCDWSAGYRLTLPQDWTSGVYLAKLKNAAGFAAYIVFVVRDDARRADLLYQQSVATYQAYNDWPDDAQGASGHPRTGKSLYEGGSSLTPIGLGTTRAVMVSFDRPYANDHGAGNFLDWEFYYLRWLEQSGYDVAYSTDLDTHRNGRMLLHYKGFLSVGHDEYWTREMYDNVTAARDAGVSLGFFGANAIYWQIRFARSAAGAPDRIEICYKVAALDPVHGTGSTVRWRDPPVDRPEQQLIGVQFTSEQPDRAAPAAFVPIGTDNALYDGSPASAGRAMGHVIGYETDRQFDTEPLPNSVPGTYALLSDSPYRDTHGGLDHQNSVIYQAGSGAWVFGAGSIEWSWGLYDDAVHRNADPVVRRLTANVLDRFVQPHRVPPARPTRLQATATGPRTVHLTWSAATGSAHAVVQRSISPSFDPATGASLAPDARDYTDDGLQPGVYYYRVNVVDGDGESPYSDPVSVATISYAALAGRVGVLLAQWRLGDDGPAVVDRAGTYSGTVGAGVTRGVPGAIANDPDRAMGFDGRSGAVRLPNLPPLTDFTLTGWTKLNDDAGGNDSGDNALFAATGSVRLLARPGTGTATAYAGLWVGGKEYGLDPETHRDNVDRWVFWALTRHAGTLTLYRDGVPIDRRIDLPAAGTIDVSGWIGAQDGDTYRLHGVIDEVAVYGSTLTADDLMALYGAALTGPKP